MDFGYVFITANYRLLLPCTAHDIVDDIKDLFTFIRDDINKVIQSHGRNEGVDSDKLVAAGSSAGCTCVYLSAIHANPKPKAILSVYGMGGDFMVRCYFYKWPNARSLMIVIT